MSVHLGSDLARTPVIVRLPCLSCNEETLHRASKCIHCGRLHAPIDHVRQVKLDSINVYRLGVTRSPKQIGRMGNKRDRRSRSVAWATSAGGRGRWWREASVSHLQNPSAPSQILLR